MMTNVIPVSLMPHILHSLMGMCPSGTIIFVATNSGISDMFSPLESALHNHFLSKLVLHAVSDIECRLFSFPVHLGGLGICNPMSTSVAQFDFSRTLLHDLIDVVLTQNSALCPEVIHHQNNLFRQLSSNREKSLSAQLQSTISDCPQPLRWAVEC